MGGRAMKRTMKDMPSLDKAVMGLSEKELRRIVKKQEAEEVEKYIEKLESKGYFVRKIAGEAV